MIVIFRSNAQVLYTLLAFATAVQAASPDPNDFFCSLSILMNEGPHSNTIFPHIQP